MPKTILPLAGALALLAVPAVSFETTPLAIVAETRLVPGGANVALVTVANTCALTLDNIQLKCVFTREGKPAAVGQGFVQRLLPGSSDTVEVYVNNFAPSDAFTCRATQATVFF